MLAVETFSGEIRITPTDGDSVEITVLQQCDEKTGKDAAAKFADLDLAVTQEKDGRVVAKAEYRRKVTFTWQKWRRWSSRLTSKCQATVI